MVTNKSDICTKMALKACKFHTPLPPPAPSQPPQWRSFGPQDQLRTPVEACHRAHHHHGYTASPWLHWSLQHGCSAGGCLEFVNFHLIRQVEFSIFITFLPPSLKCTPHPSPTPPSPPSPIPPLSTLTPHPSPLTHPTPLHPHPSPTLSLHPHPPPPHPHPFTPLPFTAKDIHV